MTERKTEFLSMPEGGSGGGASIDDVISAVLDDTNTTALFWNWWPQSESHGTKWDRLCAWFEMLQNNHTYTIRMMAAETSGATDCTPLDDLAGKVAAPLMTDTSAAEADWTVEDRMTWYIRANAVSLANGDMDILYVEGEDGFDITGEIAPVYTFAPALWRKTWESGGYAYKSWRSSSADGYAPYAGDVAPDGTKRVMTWHPTFPGVLNAAGALTSGAGKPVYNFASAATGLEKAKLQTVYDALWNDCDSVYVLDMWQFRHWNKENSGILEGCTNYNYQYAIAVAENGVKRVIVTSAQGANFLVGSTVSVGERGSNTDHDRGNAYMRNIADKVRILSKETVTIDGTAYVALNLDVASEFDTTTTCYVSTMPWHSGATECVPGHHDGSPNNLKDGKSPVRIAGIELLHGVYDIGIEPLWNVTSESDGGFAYTAYACRDSEKLKTSVTSDYVAVDAHTFTSAEKGGWRYVKEYSDDTESLLPHSVGGSSSTYLKSAFSVAGSDGVRVPWRRGCLGYGDNDGLACAVGDVGPTVSYWTGSPRLAGSGKKRGEWVT